MTAITDTQMRDLRSDAGLTTDDESVFTNVELQRIWDRVSGAVDDASRHEASLGLMFRQLLSSAAKLNDYRIATSQESKSQVFKHLQTLYGMYKGALEEALDVTPNPIAFSSIRPLVRTRDNPSGTDEGWEPDDRIPPDDF